MSEKANKKSWLRIAIFLIVGAFVGLLHVFLTYAGINLLGFFLPFGGILILLILLKRPEYGLVLLVVWQFVSGYLFGSWEKSLSLLIGALGTGSIIYLVYQLIILRKALVGKIRLTLKDRSISFLMGLFFVWAFFSAGYGILKGNELHYVVGDFYWVVIIPLVYFLTLILIKNGEQCRRILYLILAFVSLCFVVDLVRYALGKFGIGYILEGLSISRLQMTASAPFSVITAPLVFSFYLLSQGRRRWLWLLLTVISILVLIVSLTRTYWYAFLGATLFIFFLLSLKDKVKLLQRTLPILLMVFLVGSLVLAKLGLGVGFANLVIARGAAFQPASKFIEVRDIALHALQNPLVILIGEGLGGKVRTWVVGPTVDEIAETHFIHNNYARIFLHEGAIGLTLYLMMALTFLKRAIKFFRESNGSSPFTRSLVLGGVGAFTATLIGAIGTNTLFNIFTYVLMAMVMAMICEDKKLHWKVGGS